MSEQIDEGGSGRLSAQDWEMAALDAMCEHGLKGLSVEAIARNMGVTKGSFYWHFKSRDALLEATLMRWEALEREQVFLPIESLSDAKQQMEQLFVRVGERSDGHKLYSQLVREVEHPIIGPVIARVSQRRMDWLTHTLRKMGMDRTQAMHRARLIYSAYVGYLQLTSHETELKLDGDAFGVYLEHAMTVLIPSHTEA